MSAERSGQAIYVETLKGQLATGGARGFDGGRQLSTDGTSRMNREVQVRICERLGVKFPGPTRLNRQSSTRADVSRFAPKSGPKPVLDQLVRGTVGSRQQGVGHGHWHGAARTDGPLRTLHNLNRHAEVDEPRLQERQRQHVPRVDVVCAVAGVRPYIEV